MQNHENIEERVQRMRVPKPVIKVLPYERLCKNIHDDPNKRQNYPSETSHCLPTPIMKFRQLVGPKPLRKINCES